MNVKMNLCRFKDYVVIVIWGVTTKLNDCKHEHQTRGHYQKTWTCDNCGEELD